MVIYLSARYRSIPKFFKLSSVISSVDNLKELSMKFFFAVSLLVAHSISSAGEYEVISVARTKVINNVGCPASIVESSWHDTVKDAEIQKTKFRARNDLADHGSEIVGPGETAVVYSFDGKSAFAPKCPSFTKYRVIKGASMPALEMRIMRSRKEHPKDFLSEPGIIRVSGQIR